MAITTLRVRSRNQEKAARVAEGSAAGLDGGGLTGGVVESPLSISLIIDG
jgi:hypothetical protein